MRRALAIALLAAALPAAAAHADRPRWDTRTLATVPPPGYPARAYVAPNGRIYEGTYDNPSGDTVPSRVFEYLADGTLLRSWTIRGQDLSQAHGVQVATSDAKGRLVLLDKAPARVILLDPRTGAQTTYATFADLPALPDQTPMPDYGAWGPDGSLYVTDYQQASSGASRRAAARRRSGWPTRSSTAARSAPRASRSRRTTGRSSSARAARPGWRRPTRPRAASSRSRSAPTGAPARSSSSGRAGPPRRPTAFAIAKSGRIYVALVSPIANQIVAVGPDGKEVDRSPATFDAPSSVAFLQTA